MAWKQFPTRVAANLLRLVDWMFAGKAIDLRSLNTVPLGRVADQYEVFSTPILFSVCFLVHAGGRSQAPLPMNRSS